MANYSWDVIKMAAELTKAALAGDRGGVDALNYPLKAKALLETLTETIDKLYGQS